MAEKKAGTDIVNIKAQLAREATEDVTKRIQQPGGDTINVTQGKKFSMPGGEQSDGPITGVVLEYVAANRFFDQPYKKGDKDGHLACFATGTIPLELVPSDRSPDKQAKTCKSCEQNAFPGGGAPKPCSNTRLLALVTDDGNPESPILILKVSPTGIRAWDKYVLDVKALNGMTPISVVTDVYFDPALDYGSLRFKTVGENKNLALHFGRREAAMQRLMVEPDVSNYKAPGKAPAKGKR